MIIRQKCLSKNQIGITLIESLVAMSILAIVASYSVPSVMAIMSRTSIRATQALLIQHIRETRLDAKASKAVAYLCPSDNGTSCLNSKHWHQGWLSYLDQDNSGQYDELDTLITLYQPAKSLDINVSLNAGRAKAIKIDAYGVIRTSGNLRICDAAIALKKIDTIKLNNQGRFGKEKRNLACE